MRTQKALVTGASSGIGRVFATELARQGYEVTCVARNRDKLKELVGNLGEGHRFIGADLTDRNGLDIVCSDIDESAYHLFINNAGCGVYDTFGNTPLSKVENLIQLNIVALVQLAHVFVRGASAGDALINVSSVLSLLPYPGGAVYSGTKAFVTNFTEGLWYEGRVKGVYVMALLPGITDTNFHKVAFGERKTGRLSGPSYAPEVVVREALAALKARKKPTVISGARYRLLAMIMTRFMGRTAVINAMGKNSPGMK